ncbi:hypothetical protein DGI_3376 [Megalodesulfovibrio gigas DSM 1382 = ATCC 19364]|uniref:Uncharacterized protein n=1 Tax=Megalodesulfovibrio gigas (strain ATCC 19364 / DSM 1382 / NCIMB 9332 / VKM B-1759) TaxID=1121448 RepID=T2GES2_MEGG1|nr:hypothetical protein DGI_2087 [Megalodesulfovibrio gigas DSM 1382 = ATCC 19364]AGW15065.1 hypothetical protein DGI_3376 [Megalodesulfovibrio gigas DSM 1382 = ATCC 19364]
MMNERVASPPPREVFGDIWEILGRYFKISPCDKPLKFNEKFHFREIREIFLQKLNFKFYKFY